MFPSNENPSYGIFVSNFVESFPDDQIRIVDKTVIRGKKKGIALIFAYLRFTLEAVWKLNRNKFDLVYVHYLQHSIIPLHFWVRRTNVLLVLNAHGTDITKGGRFYAKLRQWNASIFRKADLVVAPSAFFLPKLEDLGIDRDRLFIYPSGGIDSGKFYPVVPKFQPSYTLGYLGRIDSRKGVDTMLKAFSKVTEGFKVKLEIYGPGKLIAEMKILVAKLGIDAAVNFHGVLSQSEIRQAVQHWDAMIYPSELEESLGLVGIEVMACGIPVIGSGAGGMSTYLKSGLNGICFDLGDVQDLKEKIIQFYSSSQNFRNQLAQNAIVTGGKYETKIVNSQLRSRIKSIVPAGV